MDTIIFDLQLFADGAAGGDGGAAAGAEGATGVTAPAAGELRQRKRKENPLANVRYGVQPQENAQTQPATGNAEAADNRDQDSQKEPTFEELIKGKYKKDYDERMQSTIRERLKANNEMEERMNRMAPLLEALGKKYNVDPSDTEQLAKVIGDDDSLYEEEAMERGMSVESLKAIKQMERENEIYKQREQESIKEQRMRDHFNSLAQQADQVKQLYPSFDLMTEMQNPRFAQLTAPGVNVDVRTAYEVVHRDELAGAEMQFAVQKSAERMSKAIQSGSKRPSENGAGGQQATAPIKTDPRSLTPADRAEIKARALRGELIAW